MAASEHPAGHRLDAVAAGDAEPGVSEHLKTCDACARYVSEVRAQASAFDGRAAASAMLAKAQAKTRANRMALPMRAAVVAAPLLAAAVVLLLVHARSTGTNPLELASAMIPAPTAPLHPGESHFKGGLVVAVIRDRGGVQERLTGPFATRAGDRVRVEVSIDSDRPLAAGLLTDDGQWVALLVPTALEAGTHYSESDARFDESPTHATLLVGDPDAVQTARATRDFSRVVAWPVTSGPTP